MLEALVKTIIAMVVILTIILLICVVVEQFPYVCLVIVVIIWAVTLFLEFYMQ